MKYPRLSAFVLVFLVVTAPLWEWALKLYRGIRKR